MRALFKLLAGMSACSVVMIGVACAADAESGQRLAERWCTSCHAASAAQKSASTDAPPFSAIASKPDFNARALALFLLDPHPKMPDMGLSREAATDLAAYIEKQRQ